MSESEKVKMPRRGPVSIGQAATRRREQLDKLREVELRRQETYRQERERLAREVAELEVQARRIERQQQLKEKQRACFLLGELILDALQTQGMTDLQINGSDLNQLRPEHLALISAVVGRRKADRLMPASTHKTAPAGPDQEPDVVI